MCSVNNIIKRLKQSVAIKKKVEDTLKNESKFWASIGKWSGIFKIIILKKSN